MSQLSRSCIHRGWEDSPGDDLRMVVSTGTISSQTGKQERMGNRKRMAISPYMTGDCQDASLRDWQVGRHDLVGGDGGVGHAPH